MTDTTADVSMQSRHDIQPAFEAVVQRVDEIVDRAFCTDPPRSLDELNGFDDHIFIKGSNGRTVFANEAYRQFWNLDRDVVGQLAEAYLGKTLSTIARHADAMLRLGATSLDYRCEIQGPDGAVCRFRTMKRELAKFRNLNVAVLGVSRLEEIVDGTELKAKLQLLSQYSIYQELRHREKEICRFTAIGSSAREIAEALQMSPRAVELNRRKLYEKLGIEGSTQLTAMLVRFQERGMLDLDL